ncbi:MAG TPA: hypothetical protein VFB85_08805 [Vicinamibacterales bacterium]|jgi:hypothetical protein|nr:hypothetical protein [Vicinamibacterales bacterium]
MRDEGSSDAPAADRLGIITRLCQMRVLNCSASGCLIETERRFDVGAVASIRVVIDGRELVDDVQIVRCQPIAGAGSVYHLGARFLWTNPPGTHSLRTALWRA